MTCEGVLHYLKNIFSIPVSHVDLLAFPMAHPLEVLAPHPLEVDLALAPLPLEEDPLRVAPKPHPLEEDPPRVAPKPHPLEAEHHPLVLEAVH